MTGNLLVACAVLAHSLYNYAPYVL